MTTCDRGLQTFVVERILLLIGGEAVKSLLKWYKTSLAKRSVPQHVVNYVHDGAEFGKCLFIPRQSRVQ